MKKIFSLLALLVMMTACGGDEDESLISDPMNEIAALSDQIRLYVGGDSVPLFESPEPLRFISNISCADSSFSQSTSFSYDDQNRLHQMSVVQNIGGQVSRRTTEFRYTPSRISYETIYFVDSTIVYCKDKGYVYLDKKGRAAKGVRQQMRKKSMSDFSVSIFDDPSEILQMKQKYAADNWIRCLTDYDYRYDKENTLIQVNEKYRSGNVKSAERSDFIWNVGNLALISDTHADCSFMYSRVPNKTNLDLNIYLSYALNEKSCCTDALLGLIGIYGSRSAQLYEEYSDEDCTCNLHYVVDDDGYVTRIVAERVNHETLYGVDATDASANWAKIDASEDVSALQPAHKPVTSQIRSLTVSYM